MFRSRMLVGALALAMAVASLWVAGPASAAPLNAAGPIVVNAQDTNSGQVMVTSVNAPSDGWLLIWHDLNGAPGGIIGWAPVHQGMNQNVVIDLRAPRDGHPDAVTPILWATFAADSGATNPLGAPDTSSFEPWTGGLAVPFSSTAAGGPAPAAAQVAGTLPATGGAANAPATGGAANAPATAKIVVSPQDTNNGQVVVTSVNAPTDGWLLIWRDANGAPAGIIGWAPVHQGMNQNVVVDLRLTREGHNDQVTQTLWATFAADSGATNPLGVPATGSFEPWAGGPAVAFSSTAAGGAAH